ncbi:hypothetical protein ACH4SK_38905 [Streptomyces inhibens]|uniref:hypothetical protein n=1 Tax=Streptomyces inhibens TaxID=2293571 RepID=UPI0037A4FFC0
MTRDDALKQLSRLAHERAFGSGIGSACLIQAGLDALLAGVDCESLAMLAGLGRNEELEAPDLFERVLDELGLGFEAPTDRRAAKWAMAYWLAGQMVDGSLDPAVGAFRIWSDVAWDLDYPEDLQSLVACAVNLDGWDESWGVPVERLKNEALEAAAQLLSQSLCYHLQEMQYFEARETSVGSN